MTVLLQKDAGRFLFLSFLFDSTENEELVAKESGIPAAERWMKKKSIKQRNKQTINPLMHKNPDAPGLCFFISFVC